MFEITKGIQHKPIKTVIYGVEGIGKSTLAADFPDPLFIDTEGSTARMNVSRFPNPTSYEMLKQEIDEVIRTKPCKTLVIDTFDWVEKLAVKSICDRSQKLSITSFGYGEGFIQLEEEIGRLLNRLTDVIEAGINVVITAHAQIKPFNQPDADNSYDRYELKLGNKTSAKTSSMLKEWADMVLFCNYKTYAVAKDDKGTKHKGTGGQRVMYTTHSPAWDAKNRFDLPNELPLSFDGISHLFKDQTPASPEEKTKEFFGKENVEVVNAPAPEYNINHVWSPVPYTAEEEESLKQLNPKLVDLMRANHVHESELMKAVVSKGHMPHGMPIRDYPAEYVEGCLIAAWPQVFEAIEKDRELPF